MTPERITEVKKILEKMNPGSQLFPITVGDLLSLLATLEETQHQLHDQEEALIAANGLIGDLQIQLAEAQQTIARQREVWQELKSVVSTNATGGRGEDINDYDIMLNIMGDLEGETQP